MARSSPRTREGELLLQGFTNETRNAIEEASESESKRSGSRGSTARCAAAVTSWRWPPSGACIGRRRQTTPPCRWPEVPLLAVPVPGTGGLTTLVYQRKSRRDRADFFCNDGGKASSARGAVEWSLVDEVLPRSRWAETATQRARELREDGPARAPRRGVAPRRLPSPSMATASRIRTWPARSTGARGISEITRPRPGRRPPIRAAALAQARPFWPLAVARDLDVYPAPAHETRSRSASGSSARRRCRRRRAHDRLLLGHQGDWFLREVRLYHQARAQAHRRPSSRSVFRADRAWLVLRGHAARAGRCGRSLVDARRHAR